MVSWRTQWEAERVKPNCDQMDFLWLGSNPSISDGIALILDEVPRPLKMEIRSLVSPFPLRLHQRSIAMNLTWGFLWSQLEFFSWHRICDSQAADWNEKDTNLIRLVLNRHLCLPGGPWLRGPYPRGSFLSFKVLKSLRTKHKEWLFCMEIHHKSTKIFRQGSSCLVSIGLAFVFLCSTWLS